MNNWNNWNNNNGNCGCHKEEEKEYFFKCEMVEKEKPCKNQQQNPCFRPNKNCCCN